MAEIEQKNHSLSLVPQIQRRTRQSLARAHGPGSAEAMDGAERWLRRARRRVRRRVGGRYRIVMRAPDDEEHDVRVYRGRPRRKLVYTWA